MRALFGLILALLLMVSTLGKIWSLEAQVAEAQMLTHIKETKAEVLTLKLEACEAMYLDREKQADACWATLSEVLP